MRTTKTLLLLNSNAPYLSLALQRMWLGVDASDLEMHERDSLGSDDVPHASLTESHHAFNHVSVADFERAYGPWGCHRELHWDQGPQRERPASGLDVKRICDRMVAYLQEFNRRNGACYATFSPTFLNEADQPRLVVLFGPATGEQILHVARWPGMAPQAATEAYMESLTRGPEMAPGWSVL